MKRLDDFKCKYFKGRVLGVVDFVFEDLLRLLSQCGVSKNRVSLLSALEFLRVVRACERGVVLDDSRVFVIRDLGSWRGTPIWGCFLELLSQHARLQFRWGIRMVLWVEAQDQVTKKLLSSQGVSFLECDAGEMVTEGIVDSGLDWDACVHSSIENAAEIWGKTILKLDPAAALLLEGLARLGSRASLNQAVGLAVQRSKHGVLRRGDFKFRSQS